MTKWIRNILGAAIILFLLWYLSRHWEELKIISKLGPKQLLIIYFLCFLSLSVGALVDKCLLKALNTRAGFWDIFCVNNAASLLNYVPMKFGTIFRANYLKRHYGLAYTHFATFFLFVLFLITALAAVVGLLILLTIYGLDRYESKILAAIFVITVAGSLLFLFVPLPIPKAQGQLSSMLRNFLSGRRQIANKTKLTFMAAMFSSLNFGLTALRFGIIYHSMGHDIHPAGYMLLGTLGYLSLFISLTPGALGIRELVLGFGAVVLAVPLEVGVLAAMVDRAIGLGWSFVIGGACTAWLWHKSPLSFKSNQNNSSAG